jgi:hypothetical protein
MPKIGGNTNLLSQLGMSPISHPEPSITLHSTNLNQRLNASDYVTIKPNGGFNVIFALKLPKQGVYTFTIYAATTNNRNDVQLNANGQTELPAVYTYLLRYV